MMIHQESYIDDPWDVSISDYDKLEAEIDDLLNENEQIDYDRYYVIGGDGSIFLDHPALYSYTQNVNGTEQYIFRFSNQFGALVTTDSEQKFHTYHAPWELLVISFYDDYTDYWDVCEVKSIPSGACKVDYDIIDILDKIALLKPSKGY